MSKIQRYFKQLIEFFEWFFVVNHSERYAIKIHDHFLTYNHWQPFITTVTGNCKYVKGSLEGQNVRFLVDTGVEVSSISYAMLARLPEVIRAAFQDQAYTVTTVSGERVSSKGPVMCNIMVGGRVVTDAVIAMQMEPDAILSLPTLAALGGQVTVELSYCQSIHLFDKFKDSQRENWECW